MQTVRKNQPPLSYWPHSTTSSPRDLAMLQLIGSIVLMYLVVGSAAVWGSRKLASQKEALATANERTETNQ